MAELDIDLLACTIGTDKFALEDRQQEYDPHFNSSGQRDGTIVRVKGTGWITGDDKSDFITKQTGAASKFVVSGKDFAIVCYGQTELTLPAAACVNGGPHITFSLEEQNKDGGMGLRRFRFEVEGQTAIGDFGGTPVEIATFQDTIDQKPDALRTWTREGKINTSGAQARCQAAVTAFLALFAGQPQWVISRREIKTDNQDRVGSYTVAMEELRAPLPAVPGGGAQPVDGQTSFVQERDEQYRLIKTWRFDLLLSGADYMPVIDFLRDGVTAGGTLFILHESFNASLTRETRINAIFVVLGGADGSELMDWRQTLEFATEDDTWTPISYPGCAPVLVRNPATFRTLTQRGEAVGAGKWPQPAPALFPDRLIAAPVITPSTTDALERRTSWVYTMAVPSQANGADPTAPPSPMKVTLAAMLRPAPPDQTPQFVTQV